MIERNNPEINVDELMNKIREEVAMRQTFSSSNASPSSISINNINLISSANFNKIETLLNNAESRAEVRTKWPDKLNRFPFNISKTLQKLALKTLQIISIDQREINFNVLQALKETLLFNRHLNEQLTAFQAQVSAIDTRVKEIDAHVSIMDNQVNEIDKRVDVMGSNVNAITRRVAGIDNNVNALTRRIAAVDNRVNSIDERVAAVDNYVNSSDERAAAVDNRVNSIDERVAAVDNRVNSIDERVAAVDNHCNRVNEHVAAMDNQINSINERVAAVDSVNEHVTALENLINGINGRISVIDNLFTGMDEHVNGGNVNTLNEHISVIDNRVNTLNERVGVMDNHVNALNGRVSAIDERHIRDGGYLKNDLAQQKRLITLFLEEARLRLPEPFNPEQIQSMVDEDQHFLDAFYVAFEDKFRGSRKEIINRLEVYLPLVQKAKVGTHDSPILDVGCGRGEWLELLRESGYTASGLDINRVMLDQCRARGLQVVEADVISYLRSLPDASLGLVTGFHIIEHLPFPRLMKLLNEIIRVLKPGGLTILETPNPQNVLVGSSNFYMDPTHLNPLPSPLVKFLLEITGLYDVEIMNLHSYGDSFNISGSELAVLFNNYFYGPQDYAVVGYKA